jgi:hypothetical protein
VLVVEAGEDGVGPRAARFSRGDDQGDARVEGGGAHGLLDAGREVLGRVEQGAVDVGRDERDEGWLL